MNIVVCVKHVPKCAEAEIRIDPTGRDIEKHGLVYDINEWDDYAVEEAVRIKEKFGGSVTVVTVGPEEANSTLRKCLARGADNAIRVYDPKLVGSDPYVIAKVLYKVIKNLQFDLVLTGVMAEDDGSATVGPMLAEFLKIPHATMVKKIELKDHKAAIVHRELEGGLMEVVEVKLPALFAIQTGINEPRYVSILGIRRAMQKEIKVLGLKDLSLDESEVGYAGSWTLIDKLFVPPAEKVCQYLKGSPEEVATQILGILKSRGLF
ncbi:MAG: electron transfer flavoprotein subunit beta/FixA family protein [Candidatus Nezhaarchaeales archaeon]|nr:MAG: electron transfer flavoprotein subunit beta [Candidatus Nezhaarchaeota archaeon WYZ-LMO8]TDA37152.1 MAG: electron transfer flavoprotein subunit beta [Candidatus Nezhaarchaeota archaeon WYZ-LMO7]